MSFVLLPTCGCYRVALRQTEIFNVKPSWIQASRTKTLQVAVYVDLDFGRMMYNSVFAATITALMTMLLQQLAGMRWGDSIFGAKAIASFFCCLRSKVL